MLYCYVMRFSPPPPSPSPTSFLSMPCKPVSSMDLQCTVLKAVVNVCQIEVAHTSAAWLLTTASRAFVRGDT